MPGQISDGEPSIDDLCARFNIAVIKIPPLRDRKDDIPLLFQHFVFEYSRIHRCDPPKVTDAMLLKLQTYAWPENVRELKTVAENFSRDMVMPPILSHRERTPSQRLTLANQVDSFEKNLIENELNRHHGNVKTTSEALGIPRRTFYEKARRLNIEIDNFRFPYSD
jgi:two-component system C4-dicarboxylate transport response regulator DctD